MVFNPNKILKEQDCTIKKNNSANFVVIDIKKTKKITKKSLHSICYNTPFLNYELSGWPIINIINGIIKLLDK